MEELLKKVINLGIGSIQTLEANLQFALKKTEESINDLVTKGDTSNSETASKIKKRVNDLLLSVQDYENKVKATATQLIAALEEIKTMPQKAQNDLEKYIDTLSTKIRTLFSKEQD
ncbi:MAG: hypothetical protein LDLANPLL_01154 [Turneriella sp.]|nr:hypothetical protein [Turneriella sp.]